MLSSVLQSFGVAMQAEKEQKDLIMSLHHAKTDKFMDLISNGTLKLRPGVKNLIGAAL